MRCSTISISDILAWSDAFLARVGRYPMRIDGKIPGTVGLTWQKVDDALKKGCHGLPGGSSLALLLLQKRGRRHKGLLPPFTLRQLLRWTDAHQARSGRWPQAESGPIVDAPGETWRAVDKALSAGRRGQPGGFSLARLLAEKRGVHNRLRLPELSVKQVLGWADAYYRRTGRWPTRRAGVIPKARYSETWSSVEVALNGGKRGLAGYGSLPQLLARERGETKEKALRRLSKAAEVA